VTESVQQMLEQFVQLAGGVPVFIWAGELQGNRTDAMVVCTNEAGTGLVVGVADSTGDGGVITLPDDQVEQLATALRCWWVDQ
jgi:hypothetical protein